MKRKRLHINIDFDIDLKFWALVPALNFNAHTPGIEVEWLCFAVYINFGRRPILYHDVLSKALEQIKVNI